jgi:hypothetical protein
VEIKHYPDVGINIILPVTYTTNSVTGTSWEGTGVEPDFKVPADKALLKATLLAYETILDREKSEICQIEINWFKKALEAELNPVTLTSAELEAYAGQYGPRKIYVESGNLYYQRGDASPKKLTPLGKDEFLVGDLDYFRIKFERDKAGKVVKLIGNYCYNGQAYSDENLKEK